MEKAQKNKTVVVAPKSKILNKTSQRGERKLVRSRGIKRPREETQETLSIRSGSRLRANREKRAKKAVTQIDLTTWEGTNPTSTGTRNQEQPDNGLEAPLAPGNLNSSEDGFDGDLSGDTPPVRRVTVTFHAYYLGEWRRTDAVSVQPDNPVKAQSIADRYARDLDRGARFYDRALRKVDVNHCVRAAVDDATFTILMTFGRDLVVTRQVIASVTQLLENVGNDGQLINDEIS
ncbi:hypothetical protein EYZ11_011239 [Aspergillus tanneri]|uniref:Uncharacterized protein n=1 Tax=Aspergillus tanneri TaxID=1220188 RepID=A0A4S3J3Y2_9EURO|nr:uncharacterized protein ATNIH1004_010679 [Aspergillus tanneri]KAA8641740.1 hypothetical protein ATNIH1004_010679 [Aspergillus tanneri]THC89312.1 hypothetical protein EYZ11_011239 [Aspergillus tanneri]